MQERNAVLKEKQKEHLKIFFLQGQHCLSYLQLQNLLQICNCKKQLVSSETRVYFPQAAKFSRCKNKRQSCYLEIDFAAAKRFHVCAAGEKKKKELPLQSVQLQLQTCIL